jgi:signal transduction histidine kinase
MDFAWRARGWTALSRRLARWRMDAVDTLLAVGLIAAFSEPGLDSYHHDSGTLWATAGVVGAASLAWRRSAPRTVWLVTTVTGALLLATRHGPDWGGLSPLVLIPSAIVGLYGLVSQVGRRAGQVAAALTVVALGTGLLARATRGEAVISLAALAMTALAVGGNARYRTRALQAERAARDTRAAAEERGRIARELHDILAHHVSIISLQAGTARLLAEAGTPPDVSLLAGIESASRQAMAELRHTLGVIRHAPSGTEPAASLTLARLPELAAGTGLAVIIDGLTEPSGGAADGCVDFDDPLPVAVELTAYRVVQESLTNVLRHSAASSARVTLRRADGVLHVRVTDDGPAREEGIAGNGRLTGPVGPQLGGGLGLRGLRERVAAQGGTLRAGPRMDADGGFEVYASLQVPATAGAGASDLAPSPFAAAVPETPPIREPAG